MIVVDASAFLELLVRSPSGLLIEGAIEDADTVWAPELLDAEVLHRLLVWGKTGQMRPAEVEVAINDLRDAPIHRLSHGPLLADAVRLGAAMSGYDALYAAAATATGATLWTGDSRLARTASRQFDIATRVVPPA